jgi:uncharacterized caspase-like protein
LSCSENRGGGDVTDDLASADEKIRRHLTDAVERLEVDVDAHWERFSSHLRAERRRSVASRMAVAAAVIVFSLTAGRPLVVTGGGAIVRFLSDVTETTTDWLGDSIGDRWREPGGGGGGHAEIDEDNGYWVMVRSVHKQLNDAIGYGRWEPDELDGAAGRLDGIVDAYPEFQEEVRSAAQLIRRAQQADDRLPASEAHSIIEEIERELAKR